MGAPKQAIPPPLRTPLVLGCSRCLGSPKVGEGGFGGGGGTPRFLGVSPPSLMLIPVCVCPPTASQNTAGRRERPPLPVPTGLW